MGLEDESGRAGRQPGSTEGVHDAETVEQGAFTHARCSCGWRGPARRARDRARADASAHLPDAD